VPLWVANELMALVQSDTGLSLFNLDVICPVEQLGNGMQRLCVVDVNYFPGFDKLAHFERRFARYLRSVVSKAAVQSGGDR
jgi:inositol-1,3,4-trisphosphate 5/6-kinase / inositol-tetrakisphosphate 1-kinase